MFDLKKQKWLANFIEKCNEASIATQRSNHASAIFNNCLFIHGGLDTFNKSPLSDFYLFNIDLSRWENIESPKRVTSGIGARYSHTLTSQASS